MTGSGGTTPAAGPARGMATAAFAAATCLLAVMAFLRRGELHCDDAFISFRYAQSLAGGHGLVFNPGERVEGYSNLLHTLLLALGCVIGAGPVLAANAIGLLSGIALLWAMPLLGEALGGDRARGASAALALGATGTFQGWTSRGLETISMAALLAAALAVVGRAIARRGAPGAGGAVLLGLLAVSRPEGVLYVGLGVASVGLVAGFRAGLRFAAPAAAPFVAQLAFRVLYYGELLPNTYYVKLTGRGLRYAKGLDYVLGFREAGTLLAALCVAGPLLACVRRRGAPVFLTASAAGAGVAFAVSTGGESYPDHRFLAPVLPLLFTLAAVALPGRGGAALAWSLAAVVLASPAGATIRTTATHVLLPAARGDEASRAFLARRGSALVRTEDDAMTMAGRRLGEELGSDALLAIGDAGRIPFASGLRLLDTFGLMDCHIARQPGSARADLGYVLGREPDAVAVHLAGFWHGGPLDQMLAASPRFLDRYRLAFVTPLPRSMYFFFYRLPGPRREPFVDLTGLSGPAPKEARGDHGPVDAGGLVGPVFRDADLAPGERERIGQLLSRRPLDLGIDAVDREIRSAARRTRHGIAFRLPPHVREASVRLPGAPWSPAVLRVEVVLLPPGGADPGSVRLVATAGRDRAQAGPGQTLEAHLSSPGGIELRAERVGGGPEVRLLAAFPELTPAGP